MRKKLAIVALCLTLGLLGACATKSGGVNSTPDAPKAPEQGQEATQNNFYYDFDDVLIPKEMALQSKKSFVAETPQVKLGSLIFEGRVEAISLANFFLTNMPKDNWQLRSSFKSSRTIMVFEKADRYCIISITDGDFKTYMEVWVAPTATPSAAATAAKVPAPAPAPAPAPGEKVIKLPKSGPQEKVILQ